MQYKHKQPQLQQIESSWHTRARVRCHPALHDNGFQLEKLDFLPEWLPFGAHPDFLSLPETLKCTLLSVAWLLYNQATIDIEYQLVIPFCLHTVSTQPRFRADHQWRQLLFQTVTDESYHVQLTEHASEMTRAHRGLQGIQIPNSFILHSMRRAQSCCASSWEKALIALTVCIVTEIVIGKHLGVVAKSRDDRLQALTTETTKAHMLDESVHAHIFKQILREHYLDFTPSQKSFFNRYLPKVISWFLTGKLVAWETLLTDLKVPKGNQILNDCARNKTSTLEYDISDLITVGEEFGITDLESDIWAAVAQA